MAKALRGGRFKGAKSRVDMAAVTSMVIALACVGLPPVPSLADSCQELIDSCSKSVSQAQSGANAGAASAAQAKGGLQAQTVAMQSATQAGAEGFNSAAGSCSNAQSQCESKCQGDAIQNCKDQIQQMQSQASAGAGGLDGASTGYGDSGNASQANGGSGRGAGGSGGGAGGGAGGGTARSSGGGSGGSGGGMGGSGMMQALTGMAGMAAGLMAAQKNNQDQQQQQMPQPQTAQYDGARQANGGFDCSKFDAYIYSECDLQLAPSCMQEFATGQYAVDTKCQNFSNRYCGMGQVVNPVSVYTSQGVIPTGLVPDANSISVTGEGADSPYCLKVTAYSFCLNPDNAQCPSCIQMAASQSIGCQANPAACLAQSSTAQLALAAQNCPNGDPMITYGGMATAGQGGMTLPTQALPGQSFPVVQIHRSGNGSASSSVSVGARGGQPSGGGVLATVRSAFAQVRSAFMGDGADFKVSEVQGPALEAAFGAAGGGIAARERASQVISVNSVQRAIAILASEPPAGASSGRYLASVGGGSGGGGGAAADVASGSAAESALTGGEGGRVTEGEEAGRELAGAGFMVPTARFASFRPASDIQSQVGPSLFAMGTEAIHARCAAGQLRHCP